jgi:hypothetical protein
MMPGYPGELIQLPNEWGGQQCHSVRKKIAGTKWAVVHRNETKRDVTTSLLMRGDLLAGAVRYPGQSACIKPGEGLWATTLLQDTERVGLMLHRGGDSLKGTTSEQIVDLPTYHLHHDDEKVALRRLGLSTFGDLTVYEGTQRKWNTELQSITEEIMALECPQGNMKLRPQQCWLVQDQTEAYVAEILGFMDQEVVIRKWVIQLSRHKKKGKLTVELTKVRLARQDKFYGKELIIHPDSYTRGEGLRCRIPIQLLELST